MKNKASTYTALFITLLFLFIFTLMTVSSQTTNTFAFLRVSGLVSLIYVPLFWYANKKYKEEKLKAEEKNHAE